MTGSRLNIAEQVRALVVTNGYPSATNPYPSAFVHSRVEAYQEQGIQVEVFDLVRPSVAPATHVYKGIPVTQGHENDLTELLQSGRHPDVVLVHFAAAPLIRPLVAAGVTAPVIVWVHGFEVETWHRRWYLAIDSSASLRNLFALKDGHYREQRDFYNWLATTDELDVSFVVVSKWFKEIVAEPDIGTTLRNATVIHNVINTDLFAYHEKTAEHRREIISIRPFNTTKYANDLTVDAILELSQRPGFEDLNFKLYGRGPLFEPLTAPLTHFPNVELHETLLSQAEMVKHFSESGIFVCPTRFDSQGVSMGEAMSSGLVPVSTDISAIPEFITDGFSGLLTPAEDPVGIADAITHLQANPELFLRLSANAASSMSAQCGPASTVDREVMLIKERIAGAHHE